MATIAEKHQHKPWSMARVIIASSAGTAFEWYDFFIFGSLAPVISKSLLCWARSDSCAARGLGLVCCGLRLPPPWRADLRRRRRPARPQGRLPHHGQPDGRSDLPYRPPSHLCPSRNTRPDAAHPAADPAGDCAWRRIWRCRHLRRRACAKGQARRIDGMDSVIGVVRAACRTPRDRRHAHVDRRRCLCCLGLADPLPHVRRAPRHLGLDARQALREPGIRNAFERKATSPMRRSGKHSETGRT